jgi:D-cysteine desulfhydrase
VAGAGSREAEASAIERRFPALAAVARVRLGLPTPVERVTLPDGRSLLVKRDDQFGHLVGGNKVRGLEWLLGPVRAGDEVLTVGPRGSTHALVTALYSATLGAHATVVRWNQAMHETAREIDRRMRTAAHTIDVRFVPMAYAIAALLRARRPLWIPAGGATPRAIVGHVGAALELAEQIARGDCDRPDRVVVPLGSGGTAAGLWLGFAIAEAPIDVVAVRVVPRIVGRVGRITRLAHETRALLERLTGERIAEAPSQRLHIEHGFYGGGYGRPLPGETVELGRGIRVDATYAEKALRAAVSTRAGTTLFWLTFDGRLMQH